MRGQHLYVPYSDSHPFSCHDVGKTPPGMGSAPQCHSDHELWEGNELAAALFYGLSVGKFKSAIEMRDFADTAKPEAKEVYLRSVGHKLMGMLTWKPEANKPPEKQRGIASAEELFREVFSEFEQNLARLLPEFFCRSWEIEDIDG